MRHASSFAVVLVLGLPQLVAGAPVAAEATIPRGRIESDWTAKVDDPAVDPAKLGAFVRARKGILVACYENALKRAPALQGRMRLRFTIVESGGLRGPSAVENELGPELAACITAVASGWRTPFRPAAPVQAELPLAFAHAGPGEAAPRQPVHTGDLGRLSTRGGSRVRLVAVSPPEGGFAEGESEKVGRFIWDSEGLVLRCYEAALRDQPTLAGVVRVRFTLTPDGGVEDVTLLLNTLGPEVGVCAADALRGAHLPFRFSGPVTIEVPYSFQPGT